MLLFFMFLSSVNVDIKYDAESEAKSKWESKQKTLQGIEDAKKKEAERDKRNDNFMNISSHIKYLWLVHCVV